MILDSGGGKDSSVEGVGAFTERDDGGTGGAGGVVGASKGGLRSVGCGVDLVGECHLGENDINNYKCES